MSPGFEIFFDGRPALDRHVVVDVARAGERAWCIATVGLGNALRVGDPPGVRGETGTLGTINLPCWTSVPLGFEAMIEATSIAVEARTAAVLVAGVPSIATGRPASGTGTDCVALACPPGDTPVPYAGKHTLLGYLVGKAVGDAVREGVSRWQSDQEAG